MPELQCCSPKRLESRQTEADTSTSLPWDSSDGSAFIMYEYIQIFLLCGLISEAMWMKERCLRSRHRSEHEWNALFALSS